jgi:hypothetical protein
VPKLASGSLKNEPNEPLDVALHFHDLMNRWPLELRAHSSQW